MSLSNYPTNLNFSLITMWVRALFSLSLSPSVSRVGERSTAFFRQHDRTPRHVCLAHSVDFLGACTKSCVSFCSFFFCGWDHHSFFPLFFFVVFRFLFFRGKEKTKRKSSSFLPCDILWEEDHPEEKRLPKNSKKTTRFSHQQQHQHQHHHHNHHNQ